jgi:hypothetical protein
MTKKEGFSHSIASEPRICNNVTKSAHERCLWKCRSYEYLARREDEETCLAVKFRSHLLPAFSDPDDIGEEAYHVIMVMGILAPSCSA